MNKFFNVFFKRYAFALIVFQSMCFAAFMQVHVSSQPHKGSVTAACPAFLAQGAAQEQTAFPLYTAGDDGFVIKWTANGSGEHFQFSDNQIKLMAVHPNGEDIAVFETDGFSLNRLSVWNWPSQSRKFVKRLNAAPSSLSYSARGKYLLVGMSNMDGLICIDPQSGSVLTNKIKENRSSVWFAATSPSENTCIMYSPLGSLIYTDLRSGAQKAQFSVEQNLSQSCLFYNNVLFAGVKSGGIYVFQSDTGKRSAFIPEKKVLLCTAASDSNLYYLDISGRNAVLKMLETDNGRLKTTPLIVKTLSLPIKETPVLAFKTGSTLYIGTKSGQLYTAAAGADSRIAAAEAVSESVYDTVYDIAEQNGFFYFLTGKTAYKASYEESTVYSLFANPNQTNMEPYNGDLVLWSKNTRKNVQLVSENGTAKILFTPAQPLQALHARLDKLAAVEGNTRVKLYDLQTGNTTQPYTGTGIQDVLLYTNDRLYAAKSAAGNPKSALIQINPSTRETAAAIQSEADISFSLSQDSAEDGRFYGVALSSSQEGGSRTEIFAFFPETKQYSPVFKWADEDNSAFTWVKNGMLFTNVGKTQIHAYNITSRKDMLLERTASLPQKITGTDSVLAVLNKDGSISWYDGETKALIKNWYITLAGEWLEY